MTIDRAGWPLLIVLAAVALAVVAFILVRTGTPGPLPVTPATAVTSWPGAGHLGGRPSPSPTRFEVAPTTWRPDWAPADPRPTTKAPTRTQTQTAEPSGTPAAPTTHPAPSTTVTAPVETTTPTATEPAPTTPEPTP